MKNKIIFFFLMFCFSATALGQVGINTDAPNSKTGLHVSERKNPANLTPDIYNGVIIQRYTTAERDSNFSPSATEDGLTIYNKDEKCFNYYQSTSAVWLSLCGNYPKATYTASCSSIAISGIYTQGTSLNTSNYITVPITVTAVGTYNIVAKTSNGYYFEKSGVFPNTGKFNIILDGFGTPVSAPQTDTLSFVYDGVADNSCTNKTISVLGSQVSYSIDCGNASVSGTYTKGLQLEYNTNTVTIPLTVVETAGNINITTSTNNGVSFVSTQAVNTSSTGITLHGVGVPASAGTYTYTFTTNGANPQTCTFSVTFITTLGTFANPANRCLEIFNDGKISDGYYWVKDAGSNKYKTYCDMSNGGWTLIKSLSERTILVVEKTQSESWASQGARNTVTDEVTPFNEYQFSLPSAVVNNIGSSTVPRQYRFSIKEKGQTSTSNLAQSESSTVAPVNDYWAKDNYLVAIVNDGNLAQADYSGTGNTTNGKLFGFSFGKSSTGGTNYQINGVPFTSYIPGLYSQMGFFTGVYGGVGFASNNSVANNLTYTYPANQTFTFNKYYINDLFGLYMNSEPQLNHHIGTCSNSSDDYGGASYCNAGWSNWRPHNVNLRAGNYEGRIVQYWVK